jgi:hypothetical protein
LFLLVFFIIKDWPQDKYKKMDAKRIFGIPFALFNGKLRHGLGFAFSFRLRAGMLRQKKMPRQAYTVTHSKIIIIEICG